MDALILKASEESEETLWEVMPMENVSTDNAGPGSEETEPDDDSQEIPIPPDATPGTLVLCAPEVLFDRIGAGTDLVPLVAYFVRWTAIFALLYGVTLGIFAGGWQIPAAGIKMPVLILLSLVICLPALFTFNVLLGSKLLFLQCAAVLSMSAYLTATILASFAPIFLFFAISAGGHDFLTLLNVLMSAIAGLFGVMWVWRAMRSLAESRRQEPNLTVLRLWILIYGLVGAQMSSILRPFVGYPDQFALFRKIHSNFFIAVWEMLKGYVG